jgi:hypothetical protein
MTVAGLKKCSPAKRPCVRPLSAWRRCERRRVARHDRFGLEQLVGLPEPLALHRQVFDDRLDEQIGVGGCADVVGEVDAAEDLLGIGLRQLAALDLLAEALFDLALGLIRRARCRLHERDGHAFGRRGFRDPDSHLAAAEHGNLLDFHLVPLNSVTP